MKKENKVLGILDRKSDGMTITELVVKSKFSRSTVRTILARLEGARKVGIRKIGMAKVYLKKSVVGVFGICLIAVLGVGLGLVSGTLDVALSDQGTGVTNRTSGEVLASGDLNISVWDSLTGGSLMYSEVFSGAIVDGSWNVMIGENGSNALSLEYGEVYYVDYMIEGEDVDFTDYAGLAVERKLFYSPLGDVNASDLVSGINLSGAVGYLYSNLDGTPAEVSDTVWNISGSFYLVNSSGVLEINGTRLNATIDARIPVTDLTPYALKNQSETFVGNITTTESGYFGWWGSLVSRVTKLWVGEINASGDIVTSGNINVSQNLVVGYNLTIGGIKMYSKGGEWTIEY